MSPNNPETEGKDQASPPQLKTVVLVAAAALIVGGLMGGFAGVAIGSAGPSRELSESHATLDDRTSELDKAERRVDELESEVSDLANELDLAKRDASTDIDSTTQQPAVPDGRFPEGYPHIVPVTELPDQVRNWYEMGSITEAVALAPGVWTELPPGADLQSAIDAEIADGFCASIEAYKRDYAKRDLAGTCW